MPRAARGIAIPRSKQQFVNLEKPCRRKHESDNRSKLSRNRAFPATETGAPESGAP